MPKFTGWSKVGKNEWINKKSETRWTKVRITPKNDQYQLSIARHRNGDVSYQREWHRTKQVSDLLAKNFMRRNKSG